MAIQHFAKPKMHLAIFITSYLAMLPSANLLGFAGQEFSRKITHKAMAMILEITFGSVVEIILFMVLLKGGERNVPVIQAAVIGSILANILLCLGFCFIAGGLKNKVQVFHEAVSEAANGLLLVAGSTSYATCAYLCLADLYSGSRFTGGVLQVSLGKP